MLIPKDNISDSMHPGETYVQGFRIPETRKPGRFYKLSLITFAISIPYLTGIALPLWIELSIFGFFIIVTGIPHGAVDHIVASDLYKLKDEIWDKLKFYSGYLTTMLIIGGIWLISPLIGFTLFIVTSIYHFGQGDLAYTVGAESPAKLSAVASYTLNLSRGCMLISMPILLHTDITAPIIASATNSAILTDNMVYKYGDILAYSILLFHITTLLVWLNPGKSPVFRNEFLLTILLAVLFIVAHPLVSFAVYFGIWHGFNHFFELRDYLSDGSAEIDFISLYKKTVPFTLLSFVGLVILWLIQGALGIQDQMISLLFILISVLTLPHMLLIDRMYKQSNI